MDAESGFGELADTLLEGELCLKVGVLAVGEAEALALEDILDEHLDEMGMSWFRRHVAAPQWPLHGRQECGRCRGR